MNLKQLIFMTLSTVSLSLFAQDTCYYYKGQRIPLTVNPTIVNVMTLTSSPQSGAAFAPAVVPDEIEVDRTIPGSPYNLSILKTASSNVEILENYVSASLNPNYGKVIPTYYNTFLRRVVPSNYIYIKLKTSSDISILQTIASSYKLAIIHQNSFMPSWYVLSITPQTEYNTVEMANILYETGVFLAAEPDLMLEWLVEGISWDENVSEQWGLYNAENDSIDINASSAWNYATGRGVKVAVLDTGIDHTHDDLSENMSYLYYDTESNTYLRKIYGEHGTHVAGIVAASRNNGKFGAGVAPDAEIIQISSELSLYPLSSENLSNGINWAVYNGVDVINCSWHWQELQILTDAIDNALDNGRKGKGCIFVKSAGNTYGNISFPGDYRPQILTVGAIKDNGIKTDFSSYGDALDVVAPGEDILSTLPNNLYGKADGTSMAAPHVSGVAALILELNPDLTAQQVRDIIEQSTIKVGNKEYKTDSVRSNGTWNEYYGYGLVDALKAVQNTPRKQEDY